MADWTANSNFGALNATREPVFRSKREPQLHGGVRPEPRVQAEEPAWAEAAAASLRAEPRRTTEEEAPRLSPGAAALARYNAAIDGPLAKARLALWAGGGLLSLALIGGVGVWGYKLVLREVMGLPVVAAEGGPMRVLPADPQGEVVPSQGLAVNAIPGAGTVAPPSDVLVLAPQAPGLADEDMEVVQSMAEADEVVPAPHPIVSAVASDPLALVEAGTEPAAPPSAPAETPMTPAEVIAMADSVAAAPPAAAASPVAPAATPAAAPAPVATVATVAAAPAPVATLPAPAASTPAATVMAAPIAAAPAPFALAAPTAAAPVEAATLATAPTTPPAVPAPEAAPAVAVIPATVPGVAAALRPPVRPTALAAPMATLTVRPADVATLTVSAAPAPSAAAPVVEATAAPVPQALAPEAPAQPAAPSAALTTDLPAGTNLVQLGAFDSAEIAAAEWDRLQGAFGPFLGDKQRVIQETQSNGRTFYRLRATGFPDRSAATALCAALTAEDAACIPVTVD